MPARESIATVSSHASHGSVLPIPWMEAMSSPRPDWRSRATMTPKAAMFITSRP